ncbi:MAG TPA: DNA recombination protein RmuC [Nitrospirae bacterium]|nr:DNA recombination protein RmuC [bacterium BMS3Abin06]HDH12677.1 DNA recombination protein RmuC [Nitrospirota bacterium]HDY99985.1 DNA recombination protein RmuC [Nitrospirota bacterium]
MTTDIGLLVSGLVIGSVLASLILYIVLSKKAAQAEGEARSAEAINNELRQQIEQKTGELARTQNELQNESQIRAALEAKYHEAEKNLQSMEKELIDKFSTISLEALSKNSAEFLKLAEEKLKSSTVEGSKELEGKKDLIDKSIKEMDKTLSDVKQKIADVGKGNIEVSTLIKKHEDVTLRLRDTTEHLKQALASSKKRGEWGERMAEDIINLTGMVEGINYSKQKTLDGSSGRPDYTFFMPNHLKINMDVKFPLDNYMHYLNASTNHDRKRYKDELLKNTKTMIKQVTTREYINPSDNTVDYVIIFIPNEQVYSFINESDITIMDEALRQKVILCSPFTLYAVLAVVRQAIENFNLERTASEILELLGEFSKQWNAYKDKFRMMGERLDAAKREYDSLVTTRSNMLERPLRKIDELRKQKAIAFDSNLKLDETGAIK